MPRLRHGSVEIEKLGLKLVGKLAVEAIITDVLIDRMASLPREDLLHDGVDSSTFRLRIATGPDMPLGDSDHDLAEKSRRKGHG
jgi:hypothetical protein